MRWQSAMILSVCAALTACGSADEPNSLQDEVQADPGGCTSAAECGPGEACDAGACVPLEARNQSPVSGAQGPSNMAPTVKIIAPTEGSIFMAGDAVTLIAEVGDDKRVEDLTLTWQTNRGGVLGEALITDDGLAIFEANDLLNGTHELVAIVADADDVWQQDTLSVVIDGRPTRPVISLEPKHPTVADDLKVTLTYPATDENRASERLTYRYRWFVDDEERPDLTGNEVPATATLRGQVWSVQVAASDPYGFGGTSVAEVEIVNAPPTCLLASLLPPIADTTTALTCLCAEREELDKGDKTRDQCAFYDEDTLIAEVQGENGACVLDAALTERGMKVRCELTPFDDTEAGSAAWSESVLIDNAHPTRPKAALSPSSGDVYEGFTCERTSDSVDADGDTLSYEIAWFVNDYPNAPPNAGPVSPIDLVRDGEGNPARGGDELRCEIVARDVVGEVSLPGTSDEILIANSPPVGGTCAVTPTEGATATSVLTCTPSGASDVDGDDISWSFAWTVTGPGLDPESNGGALTEITTYPPVTGPKLPGYHFQRDALVSCVATPSDGSAEGAPIACGEPVLIGNSLPWIWEVFLEPAGDIPMSQPVTCTYTGWSDADDIDIVEVRYSWLQILDTEISIAEEGSEGFGETLTPAEAGLSPGDVITCIARPFNGPDEGEGTYATYPATIIADP